jgi:hypothetical protein
MCSRPCCLLLLRLTPLQGACCTLWPSVTLLLRMAEGLLAAAAWRLVLLSPSLSLSLLMQPVCVHVTHPALQGPLPLLPLLLKPC